MNEDIEILKELGLAQNEGKVYRALVEFGKLSAGEVSAKSGVSYSKIYNVLDSLIGKGLVEIIPEKTKKFSPADPETFVKLIEEKEERLKKAKEKITQLKRFYEVKEKQPVVVSVGRKGFYKIINEMTEAKHYGYDIKWTAEIRLEWIRSRKDDLKEKIKRLDLVRYDNETEKNVKEWLRIDKNIRKINNEGIAMSIIDDCEVMIALIKSDVTLLIKDKPFAKIMKKMFEETYKSAEEIK